MCHASVMREENDRYFFSAGFFADPKLLALIPNLHVGVGFVGKAVHSACALGCAVEFTGWQPGHRVATPALAPERVSRGFYMHYSGDVYFVTSVTVRDEHGHGDLMAPRDVNYESTTTCESGLSHSRTEKEFAKSIQWPDGVIRPRFIRLVGRYPEVPDGYLSPMQALHRTKLK